MRLIAHRGNTEGPSVNENDPEHIAKALDAGFDVEIDIWNIGYDWYLGHDEPTYKIPLKAFSKNKVFYHAKNHEALVNLWKMEEYHVFAQDNDAYSRTSKGLWWVNVGELIVDPEWSVQVLPERFGWNINKQAHGICSDYVKRIGEGLQ
jgi:hypothetical protein